MKKNLTLYILLAFLIVANGFFLIHYLGNPERRAQSDRGENPDNFIVQELKFNDSQKEQFIVLSDAHRKEMQSISEELRNLKDGLFSKISDESVNERYVDSITSLIGEKEKAIDIATFNHFKSIRKLCNEKQKEKFNRIIKDAIHRGGQQGSPPQGGPENRNAPPPPPPH
tara:strand:+ start:140 stop:649 length:510 start_codon:yes stop_codon:yes gene_type:complete